MTPCAYNTAVSWTNTPARHLKGSVMVSSWSLSTFMGQETQSSSFLFVDNIPCMRKHDRAQSFPIFGQKYVDTPKAFVDFGFRPVKRLQIRHYSSLIYLKDTYWLSGNQSVENTARYSQRKICIRQSSQLTNVTRYISVNMTWIYVLDYFSTSNSPEFPHNCS